jgi:hypothetical protein
MAVTTGIGAFAGAFASAYPEVFSPPLLSCGNSSSPAANKTVMDPMISSMLRFRMDTSSYGFVFFVLDAIQSASERLLQKLLWSLEHLTDILSTPSAESSKALLNRTDRFQVQGQAFMDGIEG